MGQRHQVILLLPKVQYSQKNNPNNRAAQAIAIHHQWLYGKSAVFFLKQFLTWYKNAGRPEGETVPYYIGFGTKEATAVLKAAYSFNAEEGYYHETHELESTNPKTFDNNDGVTMIDLRQPEQPKYCFFALKGGYEANENAKAYEPHSARQYQTYYDVEEWPDIGDLAKVMTKEEFKSGLRLAKKKQAAPNVNI